LSLDFSLYENCCDACHRGDVVFTQNITHNLTLMAKKAGIYYALWRPEERGYVYAKDIIKILERGLSKLKTRPDIYETFNPSNGWGTRKDFVLFVEEVLIACKKHPGTTITISR
jgi:hypothetical protein